MNMQLEKISHGKYTESQPMAPNKESIIKTSALKERVRKTQN